MFSKRLKQRIGILVVFSQLFSALTPVLTLAGPVNVSGSDSKNALETVGTKANRSKTVGSSGVDESTGAFTYSYPINTPKGKFGLEPNLSINYNSQSAENSLVGYGMIFTIPYIERTSKEGTNNMYTSTNSFVSSLGGELFLVPNSTTNYLQKFDDGSYQTYTFKNNIWTLTDRNGFKYSYGTDSTAQLVDSTGTKVARWYLTKVTDLMGNKITYTYEKKNGFVYPKEIWYTQDKNGNFSNKIVFERELRNDIDKSYKYGFLTTQDDRIKTIKAYTDNTLVGKFDLTYTLGSNGTRSMLSSIVETRNGTDGISTTLPATTFNYQNDTTLSRSANISKANLSTTVFDSTGDARPESMDLSLPNNLNYLLIDVNGDYFPDLYNYSLTSCGSGNCLDTNSKFRINQTGTFVDMPLTSYNFPVTHTTGPYLSNQSNYSPIASVLDVNSDGLQDILINNNQGNGFSTPTGTWLSKGSGLVQYGNNYPITDIVNTNYTFEDVNGDGMVDKIAQGTVGTTTGYFAYLNNGTGWNTTADANWKLPVSLDKITSGNGAQWDSGVRLVDMNSDGLVDVVKSILSTNPNNSSQIPSAQNINQVYLNTGSGWTISSKATLSNYVVNYIMYGSSVFPTYNEITEVNTNGTLNTVKQDVLKTVTNSFGAKLDVTYKGSAQNTPIGTAANPKLPINIFVVDSIKETEVKTGLIETTNYTFEGGKMYADISNNGVNIRDRRYAGFRKVIVQKGNSKTVKYFHQGDGDDTSLSERGDSAYLIGKTFKEEVWGGTTKFSETYRNYGVYNYAGQIYSYLKQEVATSYDTSGGSLAKAVVYEYDLAARLPKQVTNYGKVTFDIATNKITDQEGDTIVTKNIVSITRPQKVLSEETYDVNNKFLDKKCISTTIYLLVM